MEEEKENECENLFDYAEEQINDGSKSNGIMLLNDNKAGMEGLDKDHINKIIYEASKGSLYFENEQRKEAILKTRIDVQLKQARQISADQLETSLTKANEMLDSLERERDLTRVVVHVDMDAFYASVEILSKPHLRDIPMAVGSNHMLSTSNYAARKFGVRAGMPGFIAKKLCPQLVIVALNFKEYRRFSSLVGKVLSSYDPNFCKMGLDEAYLDITEHLNERVRRGDCSTSRDDLETEVVQEMRRKIFEITNLTSSAGIAPNAMLAKVCSDINKPDGQYKIDRTRVGVLQFIKDLPIRKISGIGKVSEQMLKSLDVHTCGQLIEKRALLCHLHSSISFEQFMRVGLGVGYPRIDRDSDRKSMSVERTFNDTGDLKQLSEICENLCNNLIEDLTEEHLVTKTITLKVKEINFKVKTRAKTLSQYTQSYETIYKVAMGLLKTEMKNSKGPLKLRLMGVRASSLMSASDVPKATQMSLYDLIGRSKEGSESTGNASIASTSSEADQPHNLEQPTLLSNNSTTQPTTSSSSSLANHSNEDTTIPSGKVTCPICLTSLPDNDEVLINGHIDECLSMKYIEKELVSSKKMCNDNISTITEGKFDSATKYEATSPSKEKSPAKPSASSPRGTHKRKIGAHPQEAASMRKYLKFS